MATPKSLRAAPVKNLSDYTFVRFNVGNALRSVPLELWIKPSTPSDGSGSLTDFIQLPFTISIDNKNYTRCVISTAGWLGLADPGTTYANASALASEFASTSTNPSTINSTTIKSLFICPWFANAAIGAYSSSDQLAPSGALTANIITRIKEGNFPLPFLLQETGGIRHADTYVEGKRCFIVRWSSWSSTDVNYVAKFECVIYENGKIELNFGKIYFDKTLGLSVSSTPEYVSSIVFASGSNQFRDFANQARYQRTSYELGGFTYSASFTDNSKPYVNTLKVSDWPGEGTRIILLPPTIRKKILPRKAIRTNQQVNRYKFAPFNDQKTLIFLKQNIEFPSMLTRNIEITNPDDVPYLLNFEGRPSKNRSITGNYNSFSRQVDSCLESQDSELFSPFSENNLHELDYATNNFYASGSSIDDVGPGFDQPLKNKRKITYSFPILHKTTLPATSSTILYFNKNTGRFEAPAPSDVRNAIIDTFISASIAYDYRGFTPLGTFFASGSAYGDKTISELGFAHQTLFSASLRGLEYNRTNESHFASLEFTKNITSMTTYQASSDQTISVDIDESFLVEKIVIKLPIEYGAGWVNDKTCVRINEAGIVDIGGPALTISLMNQVNFGGYYPGMLTPQSASIGDFYYSFDGSGPYWRGPDGYTGTLIYRDIIASGSVTHAGDSIMSASIRTLQPGVGTIDLFGFTNFGSKPAKIVNQSPFSGSILIEIDATTSHGSLVIATLTGSNTSWSARLNSQFINIASGSLSANQTGVVNNIQYINPFGRSKLGKESTGRGLFGKEFTTSIATNPYVIKNPWYILNESDRIYQQNRLSSYAAIRSATAVVKEQTRVAPYLLKRGDKLILSISKTRPTTYISGSYFNEKSHDISIQTGELSVTLYGSTLVEGVNKEIQHSNLENIIGNNEVVDQYEVYPHKAFYHSYTDHLMDNKLGSRMDDFIGIYNLADGVGAYGESLVPGNLQTRLSRYTPFFEKYRIFSKTRGIRYFMMYTARVDEQDLNTQFPYAYTPEKVIDDQFLNVYLFWMVPNYIYDKVKTKLPTIQPLYSYCGLQYNANHESDTAFFYDSLVPDINSINYVDTGRDLVLGSNSPSFNGNVINFGSGIRPTLMLDCSPRKLTNDAKKYINYNWSKAFPFEPRYSEVQRVRETKYISRTKASLQFLTLTDDGFREIDPVEMSVTGSQNVSNDLITVATLISSGTNLKNYEFRNDQQNGWHVYLPGTKHDCNKLIFGYGDKFTRMKDGTGDYWGTTNLPESIKDMTNLAGEGQVQTIQAFNIRGWKYGLYSGTPQRQNYVFRRNCFGQFRDMLEQSCDSKMYDSELGIPLAAPIQVQFIDPNDGGLTSPELTHSLNLSSEAASAVPYFDGEFRSRADDPDVTLNTVVRYP